MHIFVAQINPTIGDLKGNTEKIIRSLRRARENGSDIVLFPELTICGYPPEDLVLHSSFIEEMDAQLHLIIPETKGLMAFVGLVRRNLSTGEKALLNSVAVLQDGHLMGYYDKWLLPTYDVFDERRYFAPGDTIRTWDCKGKKIAVVICEDIWQHAGYVGQTHYPKDPILELISHRPDVLLNLSASPYQFQKPDLRVKVCASAAKTLHCPVILCCQVGGNDQLIFDGYSVYVDKDGNLLQLAKGFEEDEMLIDLEAAGSPCPFKYDQVRDLYSALVLGVRDYFHKSGFRSTILGLSGGIDSALVACIAKDALGEENVLAIGMPSRFSSTASVEDARKLAKNLGIEFQIIPIERPFQDYLDLLTPYFRDKGPDVTEENLQARIRGMILMALSNKLGYVVLGTGNKSELATGYCTLYGDMCGGLGVISDVTKMQVYTLARWINRDKEVIPWSIIDKPPSAELRPGQKDSDFLPEYSIVDAVLQGYVEDYLDPKEISKKYKIPIETVTDLIKKIHGAEYKRRQSPPGLRVSKKAFSSGRRIPIVQKWVK